MSRKRGPYAKTGQRRRALREAALALVQEKGHRNISVAEVAALAGVSEPTAFYHFPTKESLLIGALEQFDDENIRAEGEEEGALRDMGTRAEMGVRRPNIPYLYVEIIAAAADPTHPANAYARARAERSLHVVSTDIRRLQSSGHIPADIDSESVAQNLLASWLGLQITWLHGPQFDIKERLESLINATLGPRALEG